jgi:hypothetical protein
VFAYAYTSTYQLPIIIRNDLAGPIEKLFGQIKWVFDQQKSSLVDGKRVKTE